MALAETAELVARLSLKDELSVGARRAMGTLRGLGQSFSRTQASLRQTGRNLKLLGAGIAGVGVTAFKFAADFEEQLATINTVADVTPEKLRDIGESIKRMAMVSGTSIEDLTGAYYDLVSAGVKAADAQEILTRANKLAIGGLSTTGEAVDLLTTAINSYGLEAKDAERITDGFAQAIAAGKVTAAELAGSFARVAPAAADAGIEIDELQALYGVMTAKGIRAAEATTYIRSAINALTNPNAELLQLQEKLNIEFDELARKRGLVVALEELRKAAAANNIPMGRLLGRMEAVSVVSNTTGRNLKGYRDALNDVRHASDGAGVAQRQFEERQRTVNAQLRRLREIGKTALIDFGTEILPAANKGLRTLGTLITRRREDFRKLGRQVGQILDDFFSSGRNRTDRSDPILGRRQMPSRAQRIPSQFEKALTTGANALKSVPWDTIKGAMQIGAQVADTAIKLFNTMPKEVQQALIVLAAANKVTGGLASSLIKDLAGLALSSLKTITAANVTVVGANVVGPGGVPIAGGPKTVPGPQGGLLGSLVRGAATGGALVVAEEIARPMIERMAQLGEYIKQNNTLTAAEQGQLIKLVVSGKSVEEAVRTVRGTTGRTAENTRTSAQRQTELPQVIRNHMNPVRQATEKVGQAVVVLNEKEQHLVNISTKHLPIIGDVRRATLQLDRAVNRQTGQENRNSGRQTAATERVRSAALATERAIERKDLSVRTTVNTTLEVSAVQVAQQVTRVIKGGRAVL